MGSKTVTPDDLFILKEVLWPHVTFYNKQVEIIESVLENRETYAPAGNDLGKDFVAGFLAVACFVACMAKGIMCRIVTTDVSQDHLGVMWGEIGKFLMTATKPLIHERGGPLWVNFQEVRRAEERISKNPLNYIAGRVAKKDEGLAGHHAEFTLFMGDESSGLDDVAYKAAQGWARRMFFPGNPNRCTNFFFRNVKSGNILSEDGRTYDRKVIYIRGEDSPNVRLGLAQARRGLPITHEQLVPGVLSYAEYLYRRKRWDKDRQKIGLDAEFPGDEGVLLFPADWLEASARRAEELERVGGKRVGRAMGVDPAEGGNLTAWCIGDERGIIDLVSMKTRDTNVVFTMTLDLMSRWNVPPERIVFDAGGGLPHADRLRHAGFPVRTVGFGESIALDLKRGLTMIEDRISVKEVKYAYKDRRVQMYDKLSQMVNPQYDEQGMATAGYGIFGPERGAAWERLRKYLAPLPKKYDEDSRQYLPSKDELKELYYEGESPDEADAAALMVHGLTSKARRAVAGRV